MAVPCSIFGDKKRLFDLSHNLDDQTIVWPTESKFQFCLNCCVVQLDEQKSVDATITEGNDTVTNIAISAVINTVTDTVNDTVTDTATNSVSDIVTGTFNDIIRDKVTNINNYFYSAGTFTSAEHCGTHVDAPYHFNEHGNTVDTIPINKLIASCKVIDIVEKCQTERNNTGICDYTLTVDDVLSFESVHGLLLVGEIVLVRTGWSRYYLDEKVYYGVTNTEVKISTDDLHFPGISEKAAELLVERGVAAVGIDTASLDPGNTKTFIAHRVLLGGGVYGIENINSAIDSLPSTRFTLIVLPLKITGGSGSPARIIAVLD